MKRKITLILAIVFLLAAVTGCDSKPPEGETAPTTKKADASEALFSKEDFPRLDGSTANIPMALLMTRRLLGISEEEAELAVSFSTTPNAYMNLIYGSADLLLVYEADGPTKDSIRESGVELEYYPIGRDALVFIANEGNPVASLTVKQLQDIYQGIITSWGELGGEDKEIVAYQRAPGSGSQALITKLVMGDLPLMDAPTELYPAEMGGLIDAIAGYNNTKNALGYSVYYYVSNMYMKPGLRLMAVGGVTPSNETIADGSYPFTNEFFAVMRKDEPEGGNVRRLLAWILSEDGKQAITDSGYVGM